MQKLFGVASRFLALHSSLARCVNKVAILVFVFTVTTLVAYTFVISHTVKVYHAICSYRQKDFVCRRFGFVVVDILTWLQIMCRRFVVAIMTCRRFDRVPPKNMGCLLTVECHEPPHWSQIQVFSSIKRI